MHGNAVHARVTWIRLDRSLERWSHMTPTNVTKPKTIQKPTAHHYETAAQHVMPRRDRGSTSFEATVLLLGWLWLWLLQGQPLAMQLFDTKKPQLKSQQNTRPCRGGISRRVTSVLTLALFGLTVLWDGNAACNPRFEGKGWGTEPTEDNRRYQAQVATNIKTIQNPCPAISAYYLLLPFIATVKDSCFCLQVLSSSGSNWKEDTIYYIQNGKIESHASKSGSDSSCDAACCYDNDQGPKFAGLMSAVSDHSWDQKDPNDIIWKYDTMLLNLNEQSTLTMIFVY